MPWILSTWKCFNSSLEQRQTEQANMTPSFLEKITPCKKLYVHCMSKSNMQKRKLNSFIKFYSENFSLANIYLCEQKMMIQKFYINRRVLKSNEHLILPTFSDYRFYYNSISRSFCCFAKKKTYHWWSSRSRKFRLHLWKITTLSWAERNHVSSFC